MIGISFVRVLRSAWLNFWRNIWLSLATMVVMIITLLMMSFLYFANVFGGEVLRSIEKKVDLSVTFKPKVSADYIQAIAREFDARPDVESVRIVTSEEAYEQFRERHKDDPFIEESLKELEDNPLPASMFVIATEPRFYQNISRQLEAEKYAPYIEKVNYEDSRLVIERLIGIIGTTKQVSLVVTLTFSILVILIMFNTVRLAIYSFREEIDIMRLVGASRWFIQGPFVIESIMIALISAAISSILLYAALQGSSGPLERFFFDRASTDFNLYRYATEKWFTIVGLQILVGIFLAVFSSLIGIRRYLRD
jgi:cell division transport system permease protein